MVRVSDVETLETLDEPRNITDDVSQIIFRWILRNSHINTHTHTYIYLYIYCFHFLEEVGYMIFKRILFR